MPLSSLVWISTTNQKPCLHDRKKHNKSPQQDTRRASRRVPSKSRNLSTWITGIYHLSSKRNIQQKMFVNKADMALCGMFIISCIDVLVLSVLRSLNIVRHKWHSYHWIMPANLTTFHHSSLKTTKVSLIYFFMDLL